MQFREVVLRTEIRGTGMGTLSPVRHGRICRTVALRESQSDRASSILPVWLVGRGGSDWMDAESG